MNSTYYMRLLHYNILQSALPQGLGAMYSGTNERIRKLVLTCYYNFETLRY
jgi:hypothetical protein